VPIGIVQQLARLLALVAGGCFVASAQPPSPQMRLHVVDAETGQPVPSVRVRAWVRVNLTDESGLCLLPLPASWPESLGCRITLSKSGYVGQYISWSVAQHDKLQDIPAEFTAKLERGVSIGGTVRNDQGDPVPGAEVVLSGAPPLDLGARVLSVVAPEFHSERTDAGGQWHFDKAPRALQNLLFHVAHPAYAPADFVCEGAAVPAQDARVLLKEDFLAGQAAMTLGHGIVILGRVADAAGKPVAGAAITRNHQWRDPATSLSTDAHGRFGISNLLAGQLSLTVQAKGLAPQTRSLALSHPMPELIIEMPPGKLFRGRVVDPSGQPVAKATVQMDRPESQPLEYDWSACADGQGNFSWDSAPEGTHPYFFSAPGYHPRSEPALMADGSIHAITLRPKSNGDKTRIDGQVSEAASKAPVTNFTVYVKEFNGRAVSRSHQTVSNADGRYTVAVNPAAAGYVIQIEAPGCRMATSRQKSPGDGDVRLDFALEKELGAVEPTLK
jgi:hypothetical protein